MIDKKVDLGVIKPWIYERVNEILGFDDEIVANLTANYLQKHAEDPVPIDPKRMQIHISGFMEKDTPKFMKELWNLLLEAQNSENGIVIFH